MSPGPTAPETTGGGGSSGGDRDTRRTVIVGLVLVCLVLALHGRVVGHEFVNYDDGVYVLDNPHVRAGLEIYRAGRPFRDGPSGAAPR